MNYDLSVAGQTQDTTGALATQTAAGVTGINLNRGPGLIPSADPPPTLTNGFVANNWTNKAADGGTIDRNRAIAMGDYFQFGFTLDASHTASLSGLDLALRRSATNAPSHFEVQVSLDNFATPGTTVSTFNYLGRTNGTPPDVNPALSDPYIYMTTDTFGRPDANFSLGDPIPTIDLTTIAALQNLAANASVTFRLFGWNDGSSGSANSNTVGFRVNGPKLTGFVNAAPGFGQIGQRARTECICARCFSRPPPRIPGRARLPPSLARPVHPSSFALVRII